MARFWNKYPYTDFHELNIGWCVDKITEFEARVTSVEEDVAALKVRATALEARMSTAEERIARHESDIAGLSAAVGGIRDRVTTLENADIQDAAMLESVSSVEAGDASVTVNFGAAAYADGVKTTGTDAAVIPAASSSKAGVMLPGEKAKLAPISVSGNDVTFAGKVAGDDPTNVADFATKGYVDSLAITGSASVENAIPAGTVHWMEGLTQVDNDTFTLLTYGKVAQFRSWISHTLDSERSYGTAMFTIHIPAEYAGIIYENLTCYNETDGTLIPCRVQGFANDAQGSGTVNMTVIPLVTVPQGKKVVAYFGCTYLITG